MLFVIYGYDKNDGDNRRQRYYGSHKDFLSAAAEYGVTIVISGPLLNDDGETIIGSLFVIEAVDRKAALKFHQNDPFYIEGVWENTIVHAFMRRR